MSVLEYLCEMLEETSDKTIDPKKLSAMIREALLKAEQDEARYQKLLDDAETDDYRYGIGNDV